MKSNWDSPLVEQGTAAVCEKLLSVHEVRLRGRHILELLWDELGHLRGALGTLHVDPFHFGKVLVGNFYYAHASVPLGAGFVGHAIVCHFVDVPRVDTHSSTVVKPKADLVQVNAAQAMRPVKLGPVSRVLRLCAF